MPVTFQTRAFLLLTLTFIACVIVGTITHELGHIAMAKMLGYQTQLAFSSMAYNSTDATTNWEHLLVGLGGPLQTIATGIVGLGILNFRKTSKKAPPLNVLDWIGIFLSLFWLRELFNVVMSIGHELVVPDGNYFGGDEAGIAWIMDLPSGTFAIPLGLLGLWIALFIVFKVVPEKLRLTFIVSGLVGGVVGYLLWMQVLGSMLLPEEMLSF